MTPPALAAGVVLAEPEKLWVPVLAGVFYRRTPDGDGVQQLCLFAVWSFSEAGLIAALGAQCVSRAGVARQAPRWSGCDRPSNRPGLIVCRTGGLVAALRVFPARWLDALVCAANGREALGGECAVRPDWRPLHRLVDGCSTVEHLQQGTGRRSQGRVFELLDLPRCRQIQTSYLRPECP